MIHIPYSKWKEISERMRKMDMPTKIEGGVQGFSANLDALVNSGFWFVAYDYPEIKEVLDKARGERFNIIVTERPRLYGSGREDKSIEEHEDCHVRYDRLPYEIKSKMISAFKGRKDYPSILEKLRKRYDYENLGMPEEALIEEWYVRMATQPLSERIWMSSREMPHKKHWKMIDDHLKVPKGVSYV